MFIVMLISVTLSNLSYLNPYKDKYTEASSNYIDLLDEYDELIKNTNPKEYINENLSVVRECRVNINKLINILCC